MSYFKPALVLTAASLMAGCANFSPLFADDLVEDAPEQTTEELVVPNQYTNPNKSSEFHLYEGSREAQRETQLTSPSSILLIYQGSWVNKDDPHPYKLIVEKPQYLDDLESFIELSVKELMQGRDYKYTKSDNKYRVEAIKRKETGFWFWSGNVDVEKFVFDLTVDMKPHGRTAEVSIDPVRYEVLNRGEAPELSAAVRKDQLAVEMMNQFSIEMSFQERLKIQKENVSQQVTLTVGKNSAGEDVITSQNEIRTVFKEFEDIISALGFEIENEDDKLYSYTVIYDKDDTSFMSLFESQYARKLDLPKGTYEVVFMSSVDGVHVAFTDETGKALPKEQVEAIYDLAIKYANEEKLDL